MKEYASSWYEDLKRNRAREAMSKIETSSTLKKHINKRSLASFYKEELYLNITSFSQEHLKMEECIRKFEQLQMSVGLNTGV